MNMEENELLLEVSNVEISFLREGELFSVVQDFSYTLRKGEILGIVGESGSGKSVSSLALMGLLPKSTARITGGYARLSREGLDVDLLQLSDQEMRKIRAREIAMIFQEPMTSLNPVYKCGEQVIEVLLLHTHLTQKEAKAKVLQLFEEVKLPNPSRIYRSYPHELSGGQKQRVMIAMAIACNPSILIADEPTTALDVTVQKSILDLLLSLRRTYGMSIIFITHDLGVIKQIAHNVLVMHQGKIVERGSVDQIFTDPQHVYTKGLLSCRPSLTMRQRILPTVDSIQTDDPFGNANIITNEERDRRLASIYSQSPLMTVENLTVAYPRKRNLLGKTVAVFTAVKEVSFDVYPGETLGVVGESGCGKTSIGRSVLQLIASCSGKVVFNHQRLDQLTAAEMRSIRREIQIIFQDPYSSLNPRITIGEAIIEPMRVHKLLNKESERRGKAIALLERVGMNASYLNRYPHELSGGQRQRICIARALAMEPKMIVCDESVSALDVSVQAKVLNLLNDLKQDYGLTYIFISHDLSVVRYMSDRILVMQEGKIVEMGDADRIYHAPQQEYTQRLLASIPR